MMFSTIIGLKNKNWFLISCILKCKIAFISDIWTSKISLLCITFDWNDENEQIQKRVISFDLAPKRENLTELIYQELLRKWNLW